MSEVQEDPCKFLLVVKGDQKFLLKAPTSDERDKWVDSITDALHNLDRIKDGDVFGQASLRSSLRRNAVTITRSSSLSPTSVVLNNGTQSPQGSPRSSPKNSPRNSPIHFLEYPATFSRSDSLPSNGTRRRSSPVLTKKSKLASRESLNKEQENSNDMQLPIQRTVSTLSTSSYSSTNSYGSSAGQPPAAAGSPVTLQRSKSSVIQDRKPNIQINSDETAGSQRVSNLHFSNF